MSTYLVENYLPEKGDYLYTCFYGFAIYDENINIYNTVLISIYFLIDYWFMSIWYISILSNVCTENKHLVKLNQTVLGINLQETIKQ